MKKGPPGGSDGKESAWTAGEPGLIPGLARSPKEGNGYPPQYSCLENPIAEEPGGLQSVESQSDMTERLSMHAHSENKSVL